MRVEINKRDIEVPNAVTTLGQLLKSEGLDGPGRAVAVDGMLVQRKDYDTYALSDGQKVTVIRAFCGG